MKIALIGYGKMGKMVEKKALEKGFEIVAVIPSKSSHWTNVAHADVCIDFSHPLAAIDNLKSAAKMKKNVVMGTTGWTDRLDEVKAVVDDANIGFLYSPNFSLGIALFLQLLEKAATLIGPPYDAAGIEIHHNQKVDAPSGTAKAIAERFNSVRNNGNELKFTSVRVGSVPGTHSVIFDSPEDSITLTHTAHSREGWAAGALTAAEWLKGKQGVFTLSDMLTTHKGGHHAKF